MVCLLPESPKFLMSRGRNVEAMKVFEKVHRINCGSAVEYPVSETIYFLMNYKVKFISGEKLSDREEEGCRNY